VFYWLCLQRPGDAEDGPLRTLYTTWRDAEGHRREIEELHAAVLESVDDLPAALARLLQQLREQYVFSYYPSPQRGAGAWYEIELQVRNTAGAKCGFRKGMWRSRGRCDLTRHMSISCNYWNA
jgi:hypothetical protein